MSTPTPEHPFTEGEIARLQSELGSNLDLPDLAARYERLGSVDEVILEVLRIRLADARERPTSFNIPGEYSEDRASSLKLLAERVGALDTEVGSGLVEIAPGPWSSPEHTGVHIESEERWVRASYRRGGSGGR